VAATRKVPIAELDVAPATGKDAKGGPPLGAIEAASLPPRVALDLQRHFAQQAREGALGYSAAAQQDAQSKLLYRSVVRHAMALQRECDMFGGVFHDERFLCDQLHVSLANASEAYAKARMMDAALLDAIQSPPADVPSAGEVLVLWTSPDPAASSSSTASGLSPSDIISLTAFLCVAPGDADGLEPKPMVARSTAVRLQALRKLCDALSADLDHCRPAGAVAATHLELRLRELAAVLRATPPSAEPVDDRKLEVAIEALKKSLRSDQAAAVAQSAAVDVDGVLEVPDLLDSKAVQELLQSLILLVSPFARAAKATHAPLGRFLRTVLEPLEGVSVKETKKTK